MGSCALGTCTQAKENGGPGCRMCDVVAKGRVVYQAPVCPNSKKRGGAGCPSCDQKGKHTVVMASQGRAKDAVRRGEQQLTNVQAKKAKKKS